jgi:hypothetical protein
VGRFEGKFPARLSYSAQLIGPFSRHAESGRDSILNSSKGLIIPLLWQEPFSLSVVESFMLRMSGFRYPYEALPRATKKPTQRQGNFPASGSVEAYYSEVGSLSLKKAELIDAVRTAGEFDPICCHEFAVSGFSARRMTDEYLGLYEQVIRELPCMQKRRLPKGLATSLLP